MSEQNRHSKCYTPKAGHTTIKAADDDGAFRLSMPISSSAEDRDGDVFTEEGLKNLQSQINGDGERIPMFLDHGQSSMARYATEGMIGYWDSAELDSENGETLLIASGVLNSANPDSEWIREYIDAGMPIGSSVGFRSLEADGDHTDGFEFSKTDLLEVSLVGIPSNPLTTNTSEPAAIAKAISDAGVEIDEKQLAEALSKSLDVESTKQDHDSTMTDDNTDTKNGDDAVPVAEKLAEVSENQSEMKSSLSDINDGINKLVEHFASKEDEDEEDDDEEEEEDDEKSTEDVQQKGHSVKITSDSEEAIKSLVDRAEDGEVKLADSQTVEVLEVDDTDSKADEATGGFI